MIVYETINIGDKIGRWEIIEPAESIKRNGKNLRRWLCRCECGTEKIVPERTLKQGESNSCGCYHRDIMKTVGKTSNAIHGMSNTRLYRIYKHMKNRCYRNEDIKYPYYGDKGVIVCDEWLNSFEVFAEWAMNNGYNETLSIDRIDVNGNYCPENCRWADNYEQSNNRSCNKKYTYNGETHTIAEWARLYNINYKKLWKRLETFKWDVERALTT